MLIVLVLDHRPWDKPESPACFSCQNLQGKAATIQEQSHLRHQSATEKRGERWSTFFPRKPSATHAWSKRRWSKARVPLRGRRRADRCAGAGSGTSGPLLQLRDTEKPPPVAFLLAAHSLATFTRAGRALTTVGLHFETISHTLTFSWLVLEEVFKSCSQV